jgi:hypothetical protein
MLKSALDKYKDNFRDSKGTRILSSDVTISDARIRDE